MNGISKADSDQWPDGTVVRIGVIFKGSVSGRIYTYALLKAGGLYYLTGGGQAPSAATWAVVERWLTREDMTVRNIEVATAYRSLWPTPGKDVSPIVLGGGPEVGERIRSRKRDVPTIVLSERWRSVAEEMIRDRTIRRSYHDE